MKKKSLLIFLLLLTVTLVISACSNTSNDVDYNVTGYVTNGRGGPAVSGVKVNYEFIVTTTDSDGYFAFNIPPYKPADIMFTKEGYGSVRVQNIGMIEDGVLDLEIPIRKAFHPEYSLEPPVISVVNQDTGKELQIGEVLSGEINLDLSVKPGDNEIFVYYVYIGGEQRSPYENELQVGGSEAVITLDTTLYPNGYTYLKVLAYDDNQNTSLYLIPVEINNEKDDESVPEAVGYMDVISITYGQNIEFYTRGMKELYEKMGLDRNPYLLELPDGRMLDLESAPADATLFNEIYWTPAPNADGYKVYRSFDEGNYELIGHISSVHVGNSGVYKDYSPRLEPGKDTYYRVVPYNSFGDGEAFERYVKPLPAIFVYLESPANRSTDVSLTPTLTWLLEGSSSLPEEAEVFNLITIFDGTNYLLGQFEAQNTEEYTLPIMLEPGGVYSWDVAYAEASIMYSNNDNGSSLALSIAGFETGSTNGEFVFSTTTDLVQE
ncbi:MAG: hypothetical protein ACLFUI_00975 [Halanaerobiales bacterium]